MNSKTTYTKIAAKIIFTTMFITMLFAFLYAEYMKENAISTLAHEDAKKTSILVFESLYSVMRRGWSREDIQEVINRLNSVTDEMTVNIYRGALVADLFGDIKSDQKLRQVNENIKTAMRGEEVLHLTNNDTIEYYYPVVAKNECLQCHLNAKAGDVLGVVDVSYPVKNLKVSLSELINFFIFFIITFSVVIFIAIFLKLNRYLIKPIQKFSTAIKKITASKDMTKRVKVDDNIQELDSIKETFNLMLDSVEYQFYNDDLTGLKNRRRLTQSLEERKLAFLAIINIDGFQEINDLYGDNAGDMVLKEFTNILRANFVNGGQLYRLHSDEFAYLCSKPKDISEITNLVTKVIEKIAQEKIRIDEKTQVSVSATMGIAFGNEMLLANADTALKLAKKQKKHFMIYDESMAMAQVYEKNLEWTKRIKQAIEEDKIVPVFQPICEADTKKVVKYEALMRMVDSDGSLIAPVHFLELAKRNKLYHELTKIMINKVFSTFEDLDYMISINLSVDDVINKEIYSFIIKKLQESTFCHKIAFEIIESEGIENYEEVFEFITTVKSYGAKVSIDDFGTGYSNFEYLMKLKVDYIKIDGSMIKNIDTDKNAQIVTQTVVDFAKKMNIYTIAEFVHSKDVYDKIVQIGVDYAQGYYFGKPVQDVKL